MHTIHYGRELDESDKRIERIQKADKILGALSEVFGSVVLLSVLFIFGWLCCACSGYHWE